MESAQQQETLDYFKKNALDWQRKATGAVAAKVNIIKERNDFVVQVAKKVATVKRALDVGCGSGELVVELAQAGKQAYGVDFSEEMIELCRKTAAEAKQETVFEACSIFDYKPDAPFDLISANGFIEYISLEQLEQFLDYCRANLAPEGRLVMGSRNRLFNIFSLNSFTHDELKEGTALPLLKEALALAEVDDLSKLLTLETTAYQEPTHTHPKTGVTVATRFQYTPAQLAKLLQKHGFSVAGLGAVHYHGVPPAVKDAAPTVQVGIAELLHEFSNDYISLIPYSSSFMIEAKVGA